MEKETIKELKGVFAKEQKKKKNKCCNLRGGGGGALTDIEWINFCINNKCGSTKCQFFKPGKDLIRVGNQFFTPEAYEIYSLGRDRERRRIMDEMTFRWIDKTEEDTDENVETDRQGDGADNSTSTD